MASIILDQTTLNIANTSGSTTVMVQYDDCYPSDVYISAGISDASVRLNRMGDLVLFSWGANTGYSEKHATITLEAISDIDGSILAATISVTQAGSGASPYIIVEGLRNIIGEANTGYYHASCNIPGTISVTIEQGKNWAVLQNISQSDSNTADVELFFNENRTGSGRTVNITFTSWFAGEPYSATTAITVTQATLEVEPDTGGTDSVFYYSPASNTVPYAASTHTSPTPVMRNVGNLTLTYSGTMSITSARIDANNGAIIFSYGQNTGSTNLQETFTVTATGTSGNVVATYTIYQGSYSYAVTPIWKDAEVAVTTQNAYKEYEILLDGTSIYKGRAYKMPGDDTLSFVINPIVRDYIDNYLWWRSGYQTPSGWERSFIIDFQDGNQKEYVFTKDWSYQERYYSSSSLLSLNDPIINEVPEGAYVPICAFSPKGTGSVSFTDTPGSVPFTAYTATLNNPRQVRYLFPATEGYKYGYSGNGKTNNQVYKGVSACDAPYVLYYENAFGGFDALPINGNVNASDKITPYAMKVSYRVPSTDFSYRRYINDISKTWTLKTRWLTDIQASKMHHLFESTMVYIYDVAEDELIPVVIDETTLEYKTFKNQGRKMFNYSFTVKQSQNKIRK